MGAILKFIITLYLLSLLFSLFVGLFRFLVDVAKWHDKEKKVKIIKSIERIEENGRNYNNDRRTRDTDGDTDGRNGDSSGAGDTGTGTGQPLQFGNN